VHHHDGDADRMALASHGVVNQLRCTADGRLPGGARGTWPIVKTSYHVMLESGQDVHVPVVSPVGFKYIAPKS